MGVAQDNYIVKHAGHSEPYDDRKIYSSVFAACIAVRESEPTAHLIADRVAKRVTESLGKKHEVTSHDLRVRASKQLWVYNEDAAWILRHHRNMGR